MLKVAPVRHTVQYSFFLIETLSTMRSLIGLLLAASVIKVAESSGGGSDGATAGKIVTPDATECPMTQQWTAPTNYLCGKGTGLGCELSQWQNGLPLEVIFENKNQIIHAPCAALAKTPFLVPATDTGAVTKIPLGFQCSSKTDTQVLIKIRSPCYQNAKFQYGVDIKELVVDCGVPTAANQTMHVKVNADFYTFGAQAGAHVRGVLNLHGATCEFLKGNQEGLLEISNGDRITSSVSMLLILILGSVCVQLGFL